MSRLPSRIAALLAALAVFAGVLGVASSPAAAYPTADVTFEGRGWGHGRGLGQWGSYGYAVDHGRDYSWILNHFYGGTTKGSRADGTISVKLVYLDSGTSAPLDMTVTSGSAFTIGSNTYAAGEWSRVRWNGAGFTIERAAACGGPWTEAQAVNDQARPEAKTAYVGDDITQMLTVLQPDATKPCTSWNKRTYRGSLMMDLLDTTFVRVINWVQMEQYLRGVVPRESPASWGDGGSGRGMHALRAQAVAARSYAWGEDRHPGYKTCDTTACQVYGGAALNGVRSEDARTDRAIAETAGEIRVNANGTTTRTEFSSSTGGYTAGGSFPAVVDEGDDTAGNSRHTWTDPVPVAEIEARFPQIGTLQSIAIVERTGVGPIGGWVRKVRIVGSNGSVERTGEQSRSDFGLLSAYYEVVDVNIVVTRIEGGDRAATAASVSTDSYAPGTAGAAVLVSSSSYADAVVGAPLAAARSGPVLLTGRDAVPAATMTELQRATGGAKTVYVLGGEGVVAPAVVTQLQSAGYTVIRYGGASRYDTAVAVAQALNNPTTVLLATGLDFADALTAGAAAVKTGGVVLLTKGSTQAPETAAYLQGRAVTKYAVGGAAAAADPAATAVSGNDRYATAIAVANRFFPGPVAAGLASGITYFDAVSGGVHAATKGGPLVLTGTSTLPTVTKQYLQGNSDLTLRRVFVYGGKAAIADSVITQLKDR